MRSPTVVLARFVVATLLALPFSAWGAPAAGAIPSPGAGDRCPVCGMFVAKYPDFAASVVFNDGSFVFFDGNKDLFRYLAGMGTYEKKRRRADVRSVQVKDYYSLAWIDGLSAWYVVGSDVLGPMGKELIGFAREAEAREFLKDHKGRQVLPASGVTAAVLKSLD